MLMGLAPTTEGRRGSQRRLDEGGRYLDIPPNRDFAVPRGGRERADAHQLSAAQCPGNRVRYSGSNPKTRSSWSHRQALAIRAAHAMASSREGSSNTVKPPSKT